MRKYGEKATELFLQGYNCSQSVVGAFCDELDIDFNTAMKLASSFGGGMGGLRETCGALSGMFIVAGLTFGYFEPNDLNIKTQHYTLIKELAARFINCTGSLSCRTLLGKEADNPNPSERTPEYYEKRPCKNIVAQAADILGEYFTKE